MGSSDQTRGPEAADAQDSSVQACPAQLYHPSAESCHPACGVGSTAFWGSEDAG